MHPGSLQKDSYLELNIGVNLKPISVIVDPLATVLTSLVENFGPLSARPPAIRRRAANRAARWVPVPTLLRLTLGGPSRLVAPDFIASPTATFASQIEQIRETPHHVLDQDLSVPSQSGSAVARLWRRDPDHILQEYCSALSLYWRDVIMPMYPDLDRRLRREVVRLDAGLNDYGHDTVLGLIHPHVAFEGGRLTLLNSYSTGHVTWKTDSLVIKPMIASPMTHYSNIGSADNPRVTQASLAVPLPGLWPAWSDNASDTSLALELLVGRPRAQILRSLQTRPGTTTDLAHELRLVPSSTSHHLKRLQSAGVVESSRRRDGVYYRLTNRGRRLVSI